MAEIDNLKVAQQLNKVIGDRKVLLSSQTREMQAQLQVAMQIRAVVDGLKAEDLTSRLGEAQKALDAIGTAADSASKVSNQAMSAIAKGSAKASAASGFLEKKVQLLTTKYPMLKNVGTAALSGLAQGFSNVLALARGVGGAMESVISFVWELGKSILAIPLKIFSSLLDMAGSFTGDPALMQAFENLRKVFGSFKEDVSKNVITSFHEIRKGLTGTGLGAFQVLGPLADQLRYFTEEFEKAGAQAHQFGSEIAKSAGSFVAFEKGLAIGDNLKGVMDRATIAGTSLGEQFRMIANYSLQMGKDFGISQKVLAKDIGMMMKDVKNFGSLTQKEMSVTAVYTRKLGIEVKDLLGLVDKFDTFEDAATAAAQLNQAFGASVDAFKMMQEQDPAKRIDMLRQSLTAAGKSTENMSRQELKLLAQTTGLDEAATKLAFSNKNQGVSYDDVKKKAEKAEKAQLTQAQALSKLADSIERVVMQGTLAGSFWKQFLEGFELGIKWSRPFVNLMATLKQALWGVRMMGIQVGRMFVDNFPGVIDMLENLTKVFSMGTEKMPGKFRVFISNMTATFRKFFGDMSTGKFSVSELIENIRKNFFDWLDGSAPQGQGMLNGIKKFMTAMSGIIGQGTKWVIEQLTKGLKGLAEFIKSPSEYLAKLKSGAGGAASEGMKILQPLFDALGDSALWKNLFDAIKNVLSEAFSRVKDFLVSPAFFSIVRPFIPIIAAVMLGPMLVRALTATFLQSIMATFASKQVVGAIQSGTKGLGSSVSGGSNIFSMILGNPYTAAAAVIAGIAVAGVGLRKGLDKFGNELMKDTEVIGDKVDKATGAASAGLIQMLSFGMISDRAALEMGKNISELSNKAFEVISRVFGESFGARAKEILWNQLTVFMDVGDIFSSLFKGDFKGVISGVGNLLYDIFKSAVSQLMMLAVDLPTTIIGWIGDIFDSVSGSIDSLFSGGEGDKMLENITTGISNFFSEGNFPNILNALANMFATIFGKLVPALVKIIWTFQRTFGELLGSAIAGGFKALGLETVSVYIEYFFKSVLAFIDEKVTLVTNKIRSIFKMLPKEVEKNMPELPATISTANRIKTPEIGGEAVAQVKEQQAAQEARDKANPLEAARRKLSLSQDAIDLTKKIEDDLKKFDFSKRIEDISASIDKVDFAKLNATLGDKFTKFSEAFANVSKGMSVAISPVEKQLAPVLITTSEIIKSVQSLNDILASGDASKINIASNLKKYVTGAGLGGKETYTITNKGITMTVNMDVNINAADLEEAMIFRKSSVIREGIKDSPNITDEHTKNKLRSR